MKAFDLTNLAEYRIPWKLDFTKNGENLKYSTYVPNFIFSYFLKLSKKSKITVVASYLIL